jgi:RNA polymerase sigma factor (sigma-70 family)
MDNNLTTDDHYRQLLIANYPVVQSVVRAVVRRQRVTWSDAEELASCVALRLVDNRYALLRKFEGRSSFRTYLTTIVDRMYRDTWIARRGRWRPSAQAKRLGATALRLERLTVRDGIPFDQACEMLRTNFRATETARELEGMRATFPRRVRKRVTSIENLLVEPAQPRTEDAEEARPRHDAVADAVRVLPEGDRHILELRFNRGWAINRIAAEMNLTPRAMYRRFERILSGLRRSVRTSRAS